MQLEAENEVNNEMANRMSLFYAEATPMLKTLSNATTKFVSEVNFPFLQVLVPVLYQEHHLSLGSLMVFQERCVALAVSKCCNLEHSKIAVERVWLEGLALA